MLGCHCEECNDEAIYNTFLTDCHRRPCTFAMTGNSISTYFALILEIEPFNIIILKIQVFHL